jgi:hypothetical protein
MSDVEVVEIPDREEGLDELGDDSLLQELPKNLDRLSPPPKPLTSIEIDQLSSTGKMTRFLKYQKRSLIRNSTLVGSTRACKY